jgi:hypothetical protein
MTAPHETFKARQQTIERATIVGHDTGGGVALIMGITPW